MEGANSDSGRAFAEMQRESSWAWRADGLIILASHVAAVIATQRTRRTTHDACDKRIHSHPVVESVALLVVPLTTRSQSLEG